MRQVTFVEMAVDYPLAGSSFNYCLAVCPAPTVTLRQHFRSTDTPLPKMPSLCPPQAGQSTPAAQIQRGPQAILLHPLSLHHISTANTGVGRVPGLHHRVGVCGGRHPGWRRCGAQLVQLPGAAGMSAAPLGPVAMWTRSGFTYGKGHAKRRNQAQPHGCAGVSRLGLGHAWPSLCMGRTADGTHASARLVQIELSSWHIVSSQDSV